MAVVIMASNLPSSFMRLGAQKESEAVQKAAKASAQAEERAAPKAAPSGSSSLPLFISILALGIAFAAFFVSYTGERPLTAMQKEEIRGIAEELKALQNKDITINAPFATTIKINMSYPIKELFPDKFEIPLQFNIPIDTQLIGISATGQTVAFKVEESVPIKASVPISSADAFGSNTIKIEENMPVNAQFYSTVKVRSAYRQELNNIIDRLERLAGGEPLAE